MYGNEFVIFTETEQISLTAYQKLRLILAHKTFLKETISNENTPALNWCEEIWDFYTQFSSVLPEHHLSALTSSSFSPCLQFLLLCYINLTSFKWQNQNTAKSLL